MKLDGKNRKLGLKIKKLIFLATFDVCMMKKNDGFQCFDGYEEDMWFYDSYTGKCEKFLYNGCGGNENRFTNQMYEDEYQFNFQF